MDWVIKRLSRKISFSKNKSNSRNSNLKESKRLKLCNMCENVWELCHTGATMYYNSFPTYKLERRLCRKCIGVIMKRRELIDEMEEYIYDLGWERDRMTSSGTETLDKMEKLLIKIKREVRNAEKKKKEHSK